MPDENVPPLVLDELVFTEVYDAKAGAYVSVHSLVKGKWKMFPSDRYPWHVAAELRCDVGEGYGYEAEDVVLVPLDRVSRTQSAAAFPTGSEFCEADVANLPEVRAREYRVVPCEEKTDGA